MFRIFDSFLAVNIWKVDINYQKRIEKSTEPEFRKKSIESFYKLLPIPDFVEIF